MEKKGPEKRARDIQMVENLINTKKAIVHPHSIKSFENKSSWNQDPSCYPNFNQPLMVKK